MDLRPILASAGLIGVGAVGTYVTGSLQFRRQRKSDRVRWLDERRFEVYSAALSTLRSSADLAAEVPIIDKDGVPWGGPIARENAPLDLTAALNQLQLVGSYEVRAAAEKIDLWNADATINGPTFEDDLRALVVHVGDLEVAMRQDVQEDYV